MAFQFRAVLRDVKFPTTFNNHVPLTQDYNQAAAFTDAFGGGVFDFRAIHDQRKDIPAIPFRGTLDECWQSIVNYNNAGYGCFVTVNQLDGVGRELQNVQSVRAHFIDLDNLSAGQNLERAKAFNPAPAFAVQSSDHKFHVYWPVQPYLDNDRFTVTQRKLAQLFDGDPTIIDATRVMRLPGTLHQKGEPVPVTCFSLPGYRQASPAWVLEAALAGVQVVDGGIGQRHALGDTEQAAPSLEWLQYALDNLDPNSMDRAEWISFSAAFKQAGWTLTDPDTLFQMWCDWCARYDGNDHGENLKQWTSIDQTQVGWKSIMFKVPSILAHMKLAPRAAPQATGAPPMPQVDQPRTVAPPPKLDGTGELLTAMEQRDYFDGCVLIGPKNRIMNKHGTMYDTGSFNSTFGGKKFIIDEHAKMTDEAWKAATRSTLWTIPKVDGTRFLPREQPGKITTDNAGQTAVNTYFPVSIPHKQGDVTPFLNHLALILPVENDREILLDYLAHNVKYPGFKIYWSPLLQSAEGVGKNVFKDILRYAIDRRYFYQPKAKQLNESGAKFNGWMEGKLFFLVDEIRTDEKRDMVETLKPFITETELEIEGKGSNQVMGDTPGNWMFFSNHKDAIPISKNGRRWAIFYSALQTTDDLLNRGMNDAYFNTLYNWLGGEENGGHRTGLQYVTNYLMNRPVTCKGLSVRAPRTSSFDEALVESRGWLEQMIMEAVESGVHGFRAGWVSTKALNNHLADNRKNAAGKTVAKALTDLGYFKIGRSKAIGEDRDSYLWHKNPNENIMQYFPSQTLII